MAADPTFFAPEGGMRDFELDVVDTVEGFHDVVACR